MLLISKLNFQPASKITGVQIYLSTAVYALSCIALHTTLLLSDMSCVNMNEYIHYRVVRCMQSCCYLTCHVYVYDYICKSSCIALHAHAPLFLPDVSYVLFLSKVSMNILSYTTLHSTMFLFDVSFVYMCISKYTICILYK